MQGSCESSVHVMTAMARLHGVASSVLCATALKQTCNAKGRCTFAWPQKLKCVCVTTRFGSFQSKARSEARSQAVCDACCHMGRTGRICMPTYSLSFFKMCLRFLLCCMNSNLTCPANGQDPKVATKSEEHFDIPCLSRVVPQVKREKSQVSSVHLA